MYLYILYVCEIKHELSVKSSSFTFSSVLFESNSPCPLLRLFVFHFLMNSFLKCVALIWQHDFTDGMSSAMVGQKW